MVAKYAVIVGCLAGALGTACGDISAVPADGGAGKSGDDGGSGGGAAGNATGPAGKGSGGVAVTGTAGEAGGAAGAGGGGATGNVAGSTGTAAAGAGGSGGAPACRRELLINGDFELAMSSWNEAPQGTRLVRRFDDAEVVSHQVTPQSGLYVLRLGAPSEDKYVVHYLEQHANIPSNALEVAISGYVQVRTEEYPDDIYDEAYVQLFDEATPASPLFRSAPHWSNLTQANRWTPFSFPVNVASVAGKQMVFRILADLDTNIPTYFYFDTVSVAVTRCSP